jgi:hypothetical protein
MKIISYILVGCVSLLSINASRLRVTAREVEGTPCNPTNPVCDVGLQCLPVKEVGKSGHTCQKPLANPATTDIKESKEARKEVPTKESKVPDNTKGATNEVTRKEVPSTTATKESKGISTNKVAAKNADTKVAAKKEAAKNDDTKVAAKKEAAKVAAKNDDTKVAAKKEAAKVAAKNDDTKVAAKNDDTKVAAAESNKGTSQQKGSVVPQNIATATPNPSGVAAQ